MSNSADFNRIETAMNYQNKIIAAVVYIPAFTVSIMQMYFCGRAIYINAFIYRYLPGIRTIQVVNFSVAFFSVLILITLIIKYRNKFRDVVIIRSGMAVLATNIALAIVEFELFFH